MSGADTDRLVHGFGIGGYRSIRDLQFIGPLAKVTVLAGRNNTGKSNVLRFLRDHYAPTVSALSSPGRAFGWADGDTAPLGLGMGAAGFALCADLRSTELVRSVAAFRSTRNPPPNGFGAVLGEDRARELLEGVDEAIAGPAGTAWKTWVRAQRNSSPDDSGLSKELSDALNREPLRQFVRFLGNAPNAHKMLLDALTPDLADAKIGEPVFIPAFRQIRSSSDQGWDGQGLIPLLADLRDPDLGPERNSKQERWGLFQEFVRDVLEDSTVEVRVPQNAARLILTMNGRELDVEDLGTGVHEVIILGAAATAHERTLFLLEEPEIHLHPLLQRRLVGYLAESTTNQYVIATHSAHFLDFEMAAVFTVRLVDGWTTITPVETNSQLVATARELGYRPSDLLQANAVIWVEGPSDRIYIRYWISQVAPDLVEGVDYAIMFYGGRLVSHLTGVDSSFGVGVDEMIELRRLNRYSAVVLDSDREARGRHIRRETTKGRIRDEFKEDGVAWITRGREIENYIPPEAMLAAIQRIDPKASKLIDVGDYAHRWRYRRAGSPRNHAADKVKLARAVAELEPSMDYLDLRNRVGELVALIREAQVS